jgi:hypothetical protein
MKAARWIRCVVPVIALAAAGCPDPETVRVHDEPAPKSATVPTIPAEQKKYRTLAGMVPADFGGQDSASWWILKMSGPADVIDKYEPDFEKLLGTVWAAVEGGEPTITWDLPQGWKREDGGGSGFAKRFATLKAPGGDAEVAVSLAGGRIASNVQRWRGQLWGEEKAAELTPFSMDAFVKRQVVKERLIFRVDMPGPNDPNTKGPPMMNPHGGQR